MSDAGLFRIWVFLASSPLLWLTVTLLVYLAALWLYGRSGGHSLVNPILLSVAGLVGVLHLTGTPYPVYFDGAKFVHFLIGPATVALAIPLYAQLGRLKRMGTPSVYQVLITGVLVILAVTTDQLSRKGAR